MTKQDNAAKPEPVEIDYAKKEKMSHKFPDGLPNGIIDKKVPGIGATTAELIAPRESIIVVPTKALAYSKMKSKYANNPLYIGSKYRDLEEPTRKDVEDYLNDWENPNYNQKIIVVADSLHTKLFNWIPQNLLSHFFLMIDEIDTFQNDSNYRDSLEKAIDYYYKHPKDNRCMLTATPIIFQTKIPDERKDINVINYNKPNLHIWHVERNSVMSYLLDFLKLRAKEIREENKHVIAYNSINQAKTFLNYLLKKEKLGFIKEQVGIMCSRDSRNEVGDYYCEIAEDGSLPSGKLIVFMTSAYFSGVDIKDDFTTVIVSGSDAKHHRLTSRQIVQIAGRNRKGSSEDYLIIPEMKYEHHDIKNLKIKTKEDIEYLSGLSNCVEKYFDKTYLLKNNRNNIYKEIVSNSGLKEFMRLDKNNKLTYSAFKIDAFIHKKTEDNLLYTKKADLKKSLSKHFNIITYNKKDLPKPDGDLFKDDIKLSKHELFLNIINEKAIGLLDLSALDRSAREFYDKLIFLKKYMTEIDIIYHLKHLSGNKSLDTKTFNNFVKAVYATASDEERYQFFRRELKNNFTMNNQYASSEIVSKILNINKKVLSTVVANYQHEKPNIVDDETFFMSKHLSFDQKDKNKRQAVIQMVMTRMKYFYEIKKVKDSKGNRKFEIINKNPYGIKIYSRKNHGSGNQFGFFNIVDPDL